MRTTLDFPDNLMRELKARAVLDGVSKTTLLIFFRRLNSGLFLVARSRLAALCQFLKDQEPRRCQL